ncbi:hypothetical protein N799_08660 [Lysobacter arseniciresistens ZS79]|uniref:Uncharacterized protein n=1 Tax=Lysobacter arseniciresistens ZS79 TaxID=913325 RepID=A0A0A0EV59_9GAMM|nr:DUF6573 family protein [Lysobacter arseniciresistens]KGM54811.1 hypothetical protein N799_08660 [Lysobacter arseniciresistens ZS79]
MFNKDDVVFTYSRGQALADGVLVDLTEQAKEYGFKVPFACTEGVWNTVKWDEFDSECKPGLGQSTDGRLHDLLTLAFQAARETEGNRAQFPVLMVPKAGAGEAAKPVQFHMVIGPGDDAAPVCTLMLIGED